MEGIETENLIEDCIFRNNTSANGGGALYLYLPGELYITRCIFQLNKASFGSAIYYQEQSNYIIYK